MEEDEKQKIKGIKKINGTLLLKKLKEEPKNIVIVEEKRQEYTEGQRFKVVGKQEEPKKVDCFQLVVYKKIPWYKKTVRVFGKLFRKFIGVREN